MTAATGSKTPDFRAIRPAFVRRSRRRSPPTEGRSPRRPGWPPRRQRAGWPDVGDKVIKAQQACSSAGHRGTLAVGSRGRGRVPLYAPGLALEAAFLKADRLRQELDAAVAKQLPGPTTAPRASVSRTRRGTRKTPSDLHRKASSRSTPPKEQAATPSP